MQIIQLSYNDNYFSVEFKKVIGVFSAQSITIAHAIHEILLANSKTLDFDATVNNAYTYLAAGNDICLGDNKWLRLEFINVDEYDINY